MTEELIKQAMEAGFVRPSVRAVENFERFAALRDEAMKKRCAEIAERHSTCLNDTANVIYTAIMALDTESTNLCQNSDKLVGTPRLHRAGSFSE